MKFHHGGHAGEWPNCNKYTSARKRKPFTTLPRPQKRIMQAAYHVKPHSAHAAAANNLQCRHQTTKASLDYQCRRSASTQHYMYSTCTQKPHWLRDHNERRMQTYSQARNMPEHYWKPHDDVCVLQLQCTDRGKQDKAVLRTQRTINTPDIIYVHGNTELVNPTKALKKGAKNFPTCSGLSRKEL
eukprot:c20638_g1_i1 orf=98-652(-)